MKNIIKLEIPELLNTLYIPIVRNSRATIIKSKEAKEYTKYVHMECLRQKTKMLNGKVLFHIDILIKNRKDFDIDAILKLLYDSLEGVAYKNDRDIIDARQRKHLNAEEDKVIILIEEIKQ